MLKKSLMVVSVLFVLLFSACEMTNELASEVQPAEISAPDGVEVLKFTPIASEAVEEGRAITGQYLNAAVSYYNQTNPPAGYKLFTIVAETGTGTYDGTDSPVWLETLSPNQNFYASFYLSTVNPANHDRGTTTAFHYYIPNTIDIDPYWGRTCVGKKSNGTYDGWRNTYTMIYDYYPSGNLKRFCRFSSGLGWVDDDSASCFYSSSTLLWHQNTLKSGYRLTYSDN